MKRLLATVAIVSAASIVGAASMPAHAATVFTIGSDNNASKARVVSTTGHLAR